MSGADSGFRGDQFKGKQLVKNLIGLPIAGAIGSPQWIKKHPQSALAAAAVAATVLTAGAAAPAIGAAGAGTGAAAAGAAGASAAEAATAAGVAEGIGTAGQVAASSGGLLGAGGTNAMTGAAGLAEGIGTAGEVAGNGLLNTAAFESGFPMTDAMVAHNTTALPGNWRPAFDAVDKAKGLLDSPSVKSAYKGYQNYQRTQAAIDAAAPKRQAPAARPMQAAPYQSLMAADPPPTTPYSPMDPQWVEWLKRHPQGAGNG